jgi:hypothetical protein
VNRSSVQAFKRSRTLADLDDLERFMDDPDPGDPEAEPPDWPDAWPEADLLEVVV